MLKFVSRKLSTFEPKLPSSESKLIFMWLLFSVAIHVGIYFFRLSSMDWMLPHQEKEWVIDAQWVGDLALDEKPAKNNEESEESMQLNSAKLLPQLPNKFQIKDEEKPQPKPSDEIPLASAEKGANEEKPKTVEKPKAKEDEDDKETKKAEEALAQGEAIKKAAMLELTKKDAMERLRKELARTDEKKPDDKKKALSLQLQKRKKELLNKKGGGETLGLDTGYGATIKSWINSHYFLPELYKFSNKPIKATVEVVLDQKGALKNIKLAESSKDATFDELALKTVQEAAPFPEPPELWVGKTIVLPFEIAKR